MGETLRIGENLAKNDPQTDSKMKLEYNPMTDDEASFLDQE